MRKRASRAWARGDRRRHGSASHGRVSSNTASAAAAAATAAAAAAAADRASSSASVFSVLMARRHAARSERRRERPALEVMPRTLVWRCCRRRIAPSSRRSRSSRLPFGREGEGDGADEHDDNEEEESEALRRGGEKSASM